MHKNAKCREVVVSDAISYRIVLLAIKLNPKLSFRTIEIEPVVH